MNISKPGEELRYDSFCRDRQDEIHDNYGYRLKIEKKRYNIDDLYLGTIIQTPSEQCGDILLKDRHGLSYLFSSTLDDIDQGLIL